jgi:hypothetical protein
LRRSSTIAAAPVVAAEIFPMKGRVSHEFVVQGGGSTLVLRGQPSFGALHERRRDDGLAFSRCARVTGEEGVGGGLVADLPQREGRRCGEFAVTLEKGGEGWDRLAAFAVPQGGDHRSLRRSASLREGLNKRLVDDCSGNPLQGVEGHICRALTQEHGLQDGHGPLASNQAELAAGCHLRDGCRLRSQEFQKLCFALGTRCQGVFAGVDIVAQFPERGRIDAPVVG